MQAVDEFAYEGRLLLKQNLFLGRAVRMLVKAEAGLALRLTFLNIFILFGDRGILGGHDKAREPRDPCLVLRLAELLETLGAGFECGDSRFDDNGVCPQDPGEEPLLPRWRRQALVRNFGGIFWDSNRLGILGEPAILILRHVKVRSLLSQADH